MNLQVPYNAGPSRAEAQLPAYNKIYAKVSIFFHRKFLILHVFSTVVYAYLHKPSTKT